MARMAERLEALEAGHKRAVGRLQEELSAALAERAEAQLRLEAAVGAMDTDRQQQLIALEEIEMGAKAKEAELNARVLSLESQIHWLGEQNTQLTSALKKLQEAAATAPPANMAGAAAGPGHDAAEATSAEAAAASAHACMPAGAGAAALADKCAALEAELRRAKRAELKLQALLFRLRKDVEAVGVSGPAFDGLRDIRALEFEVDTLGQKLKRSERMAMQADAERQSLQAKLAQLTNTGALSCTEGSAHVASGTAACATFLAKSPGVLAGLAVADLVFEMVDPTIQVVWGGRDGEEVEAGHRFGSVTGPAASILVAERVALNFMQRMSGIATATRAMVLAVEGVGRPGGARILETRKTAPGLRLLDKWAVLI
ncbi:quinolinate phosphoribosyltransferase [decarboxylating], partial [Haematococcus lacustris]